MTQRLIAALLLSVSICSGADLEHKDKDSSADHKHEQERLTVLRELHKNVLEYTPEMLQQRTTHFLSIGGDINATLKGIYNEDSRLVEPTLLYLAAGRSLEKCQILVAAKADPNISAKGGLTPLHIAASLLSNALHDQPESSRCNELEQIYRFLIREGADPYLMGRLSNYTHGWTPLAYLRDFPELVGYAKNVAKAVKKTKTARAEQLRLTQLAFESDDSNSSGLPATIVDDPSKSRCLIQ